LSFNGLEASVRKVRIGEPIVKAVGCFDHVVPLLIRSTGKWRELHQCAFGAEQASDSLTSHSAKAVAR